MTNNVKARRIALGLTQQELAARAEVAQATISEIERGDIESPRVDVAARLARALAVAPEDIFPVLAAVPSPASESAPEQEVA